MEKKDKVVFHESEMPFVDVEWGRTKELAGLFCRARSEHFLMKITEYLTHFYSMKEDLSTLKE